MKMNDNVLSAIIAGLLGVGALVYALITNL